MPHAVAAFELPGLHFSLGRFLSVVARSSWWPKMPALLVGFVFSPPAQPSPA